MTENSSSKSMSSTKRALLEIRRLRARLDEQTERERTPIAIVGCGLRFPGGIATPDQYWDLLSTGRDVIGEIPPDRWDVDSFYNPDRGHSGTMYTRSGGFIDQIDTFDPQFFGISPREAASMDPQQRMLLEVTWEALEHAGHSDIDLRGSRTAVYIGLCNSDYSRLVFRDPSTADVSAATGNQSSVAAGRLSYLLGLHGPSMVVDTACSSSLVAIHLAVQSLRRGECDRAIVGGVNLILSPEMHINFCQAQMLSADGRCKTFDTSADGYGRGEGCAVVVLKRVNDALSDNDRILAVVKGSAVNQDGQSAGLTAPNGLAQEFVIRDAIADACVSADAIDYVEAHGTGTPLGDPIEARALGAAIGSSRASDSPLLIGSAKTNLGHMEAAAGVGGLIKVALSLYHGSIPKHLNYSVANAEIPLDELNLRVVSEATPWPSGNQRIAGISSFGFSGTNAHVILEGAPAENRPLEAAPRLHDWQVLTISARTEESLLHSINRYRHYLSETNDSLQDISYACTVGRTHMQHRLAITCSSVKDAVDQLGMVSNGEEFADLERSNIPGGAEPPRIVFLFSGQGAQYSGMGRGLYDHFSVYREALDQITQMFDAHLDADPLLEVMHAPNAHDERINDALYTQPATFALAYALYELWRSWGLRAEIVFGHSLGEYMAAFVSGILKLDDAVAMVAKRTQLANGLTEKGSMAVIFADEATVEAAIRDANVDIDIAAINAPNNTVISGSASQLITVCETLKKRDIEVRKLNTPNAFHSRLLDPILDQFESAANEVEYCEPEIAVLSNVTGNYLGPREAANGKYWRKHIRQTVQFRQALEQLQDEPNAILLEIGPHPTLLPMVDGQIDRRSTLVASLRRDGNDLRNITTALAKLHAHGAVIDWRALHRSSTDGALPRQVSIPTYPFRTERYWIGTGVESSPEINGLSAWKFAVTAGTDAADRVPLNLNVDQLESTWKVLRELSKCYIVNALHELGVFIESKSCETLESVMHKAQILSTYHNLTDRWLRLLVDENLLTFDSNGKTYHCVAGLTPLDPTKTLSEVSNLFKSEMFFVEYVQRCGELLPRVMKGEVAALETLFPGGSAEVAEKLYTEYSVSKYISSIAAASVAAVAACRTRVVHVLEIGAGTGGTTAAILPTLPPGRARYCFTDISDYFLSQAALRFSEFDYLDYRILDIGGDTDGQGFPAHSLDVIIATNVLHATPDLRLTLKNVLRLLKSNGVLVLSEVTRELTWFDITTGLIEGWQSFDDDLRDDSPLLAPSVWESALTDAGFEQVLTLPSKGSQAAAVGQNVFLARSPATDEADNLAGVVAADGGATLDVGSDAIHDDIVEKLSDAPDSERHDILLDHVIQIVCMILRVPESNRPDGFAGLFDLGLDSLMALDFRRRLAESLNLDGELPATLIFDYPNAESIVRYLENSWLEIVDVAASKQEGSEQHSTSDESEEVSNEEIEDLSDEEVEALLVARLDAHSEKSK